MRNAEGVLGANNELKSDHFGIEINKLVYNLFLHLIVKIRPFWDWNNLPNAKYAKEYELKSDHFGIEILQGFVECCDFSLS